MSVSNMSSSFAPRGFRTEAGQIRPCTDYTKPYIFVSYSHEDSAEVYKLLAVMQENHFRFWYDQGIQSGSAWEEVIYDRITACSQFLCFLTTAAVKSDHIKDEIHLARKYGKPIVPVMLDDVVLRGALELALDRQQFLYRQTFGEADFYRQLCASLDRRSLDHIVTQDHCAMEELGRHYRFIKQIGRGFSGKVYLAESIRAGCKVIVKHATLDDSYTGRSLRDSYMNERVVLAQHISVHAPLVIDYFSDAGNIFLVETYVPGCSLGKTDDLSDHQIAQIFLETAKILKSYHTHGIMHCDIKPDHILLHEGAVFLIDFGACYLKACPDRYHSVGSASYAAPEQYGTFMGSGMDQPPQIDCYTDIYALGRSLMFTLARSHGALIQDDGEKTVLLEDCFDSMHQKYTLDQERYRSMVNPLLRAVVDKMTARETAYRFGSMDEVIACLSAF